MTDWTLLWTPLIIAAIPVVIALVKHGMSDAMVERLKRFYPLAATALGPLLDYLLSIVTSHQADPRWGVLYGLGAIGLREIIDQWRKFMYPPIKAVAVVVLLVLAGVGCAKMQTDLGLIVAGKGLNAVGQQFNTVGKTHIANCTLDQVKPTVANPAAFVGFCKGFYDFAPKFGKAYNPAIDAWKAAVAANDTSAALGAQATILQLSTDLTEIAAQVLSNLQ